MRALCILALLVSFSAFSKTTVNGLIRGSIVSNNADPSFLDKGTGTFRTDGTQLSLSQAILDVKADVYGDFDAHIVANGYDDGDRNVGFTQAYLEYKPLSGDVYQWQGRAGFFYPKLSVENTDTGWLASNFITSSYINSWIGEELRVPGIEVSFKRSGRRARSPWSLQIDAAAYRGNDTIGALVAWKGFGLHDRQTLHHERVEFAPIPAVINYINSPTWTVPFTEIDGKVGYYIGFKARYLRKFDIRYFFYDNQADPLILDERRLYSWNTRFNSVAARYLLSNNTELSFHFLDGLTEMGDFIVFADYTAFYAAVSHRRGANKYSARFDVFDVREKDFIPADPNDSHGVALTLNWTHTFSEQWQSSVEAIYNQNTLYNRETLGVTPRQDERQLQWAMTYRF